MRNYFNFFTEIEEHFVRKRGRNLLVSPLDWCLIEVWRDSGIPLHVVLRGIDRSFEVAQDKGKRTPKTLYYCHPAVMEAFEQYQEASLGAPAEEESPESESPDQRRILESVLNELEGMISTVSAGQGEAYRQAEKRLQGLLQDLRQAESIRFDSLDSELNAIGQDLAEGLMLDMDSDQLKELRKEVRSETSLYRRRLDKDTYRRLEKSFLQRKVQESVGLPHFSLLSLSNGL